MKSADSQSPIFPMCKLAEYTVSASSTRRRSLVRAQIKQALDESEKRRWWYQDARAEIRKFIRVPGMRRQDLVAAAGRLRDSAATEIKKSAADSFLASARAIEAFLPVAESVRSAKVIAAAGKRGDARLQRCGVQIVVAPDLLFLERGSEV